MKRLLEFFQQQDGAYCALQLAIIGGFIVFWGIWAYISIVKQTVAEVPLGLGALLAAMLAAKVWKDIVDDKKTAQPPTPPANVVPLPTDGELV